MTFFFKRPSSLDSNHQIETQDMDNHQRRLARLRLYRDGYEARIPLLSPNDTKQNKQTYDEAYTTQLFYMTQLLAKLTEAPTLPPDETLATIIKDHQQGDVTKQADRNSALTLELREFLYLANYPEAFLPLFVIQALKDNTLDQPRATDHFTGKDSESRQMGNWQMREGHIAMCYTKMIPTSSDNPVNRVYQHFVGTNTDKRSMLYVEYNSEDVHFWQTNAIMAAAKTRYGLLDWDGVYLVMPDEGRRIKALEEVAEVETVPTILTFAEFMQVLRLSNSLLPWERMHVPVKLAELRQAQIDARADKKMGSSPNESPRNR